MGQVAAPADHVRAPERRRLLLGVRSLRRALDWYRDATRHGGILSTFFGNWYEMQVTTVQNSLGQRELAERRADFGADVAAHPLGTPIPAPPPGGLAIVCGSPKYAHTGSPGRRRSMDGQQRISYVPLEEWTPFCSFTSAWNDLSRHSVVDHEVKELCRAAESKGSERYWAHT